MKQDTLICLNPACLYNRQFTTNSSAPHLGCQDWIIYGSRLENHEYIWKTQLNEPLTIQFKGSKLRSLFQVLKLRDWPIEISKMYDHMKEAACQEIEKVKQQKIREFNSLLAKAEKAYNELLQNVSQLPNSAHTLTSLKTSFLQDLENQEVLNLNHINRAKVYFKKIFVPTLRCLCNFVQQRGSNHMNQEQGIKQQAQRKTLAFLNENTLTGTNEKLQKLASLIGKGTAKASYDSMLQTYTAQCWICNLICIPHSKEQSKQGCLQQLLNHLLTKHKEQVVHRYINKILKFNVVEISLANFLNKINCQQFSKVIVVDRENCGTFEKPTSIEMNTVWIQVVNKKNKNLAKGQFITADSTKRDAADIIMSVLIYEIAKTKNSRIILVTKDHFGTTLKDLINNIFKNKIEVFDPKDLLEFYN